MYATELKISQSDGLHRIVCLTEWCIIEYRLTNYYDKPNVIWQTPIIMTNPNFYDKPQLLLRTLIIMTPTNIMTPNIWFRPIMDMTIVYFVFSLQA